MSEDGDLESLIGNSRTLQSFTSAALETEHEDSGDGKPLSRRQRRLRQRERANLEASLKQEELVRAARQQERADEEDAAGPAPLPIKVRNKITLPKATPKSELRSLPSDSKDTKDDDQDERTGPRTKRSKSAAASGGDDEDDAALMEMAAADSAPLPPTALLALRKEEIASACSAVLEAPETHITKLGSIIDLCRSNDAAIKFAVRKLAIASLTAVFRDIIPGYHIRQLTEKEQTQRMTKEVKQVREYEGSLLKMYQAFLQHLHTCIKDLRESRKAYVKKHGPKMPASIAREEKDLKRVASLALLAAQSLCQLLETAPHFNFRNNIITVITPLMTGKLGSHLSRVTTSCAIDVFKADQAYDVSLSLAKAIAQEIKTSAYNVDPQMVGCFRFLKIQERHIKAKKRDAEQDVKQSFQDIIGKASKFAKPETKELVAVLEQRINKCHEQGAEGATIAANAAKAKKKTGSKRSSGRGRSSASVSSSTGDEDPAMHDTDDTENRVTRGGGKRSCAGRKKAAANSKKGRGKATAKQQQQKQKRKATRKHGIRSSQLEDSDDSEGDGDVSDFEVSGDDFSDSNAAAVDMLLDESDDEEEDVNVSRVDRKRKTVKSRRQRALRLIQEEEEEELGGEEDVLLA